MLRCVLDHLLTTMSHTIPSAESSSVSNNHSHDQSNTSAVCKQIPPQMFVVPCLPVRQETGARTPSLVHSLFVYHNSILLIDVDEHSTASGENDCTRQSFGIAMKSATVIFNLGLAFHRLGLELPNESESRGQFFVKASTFYRQAIALSLPYLPSSSYQCEHSANVSTMICLAALNNLGQIHFDHFNDCESARGVFEQFRQIAENDSIIAVCSRLFSEQDWIGFISNLALVSMIAGSMSAGAA